MSKSKSATSSRVVFVPADESKTTLNQVARKSASKFKQGYKASQSDIKPFWLFAAVFLAIIWIIIGALGVKV